MYTEIASRSRGGHPFLKPSKTLGKLERPFLSLPEATGPSLNILKSHSSDGTVSILEPLEGLLAFFFEHVIHHRWLDPPASLGAVTILDILAAKDPTEHALRARRWTESVWEAWTPHHDLVRRVGGWCGAVIMHRGAAT